MRKIIQLSVAAMSPRQIHNELRGIDEELRLAALCDDGSAWLINPDQSGAHWERLPGIPQEP